MDIESLNNKIVIINNELKDKFLECILNCHKLVNIKILTIDEFIKKYTFSYNKATIFYIMKKYNVIYDIAKIYLENIRYVNKSVSDKTKFLLDLKNDLIANNLLILDDNFKNFLIGKDIVICDIYNPDKYLQYLFNDLSKIANVNFKYLENYEYHHNVYQLNNKDDEIVFVASKIVDLINNGIDINKIKIANLNSNYIYSFIKTFKLFNIPIEIPSFSTLSGTIIVKKFKELFLENSNNFIDDLKKYVKDSEDIDTFNKIISVINNYSWCDNLNDVRDMIFEDVDKLQYKSSAYDNAVRVVDFKNNYFSDDEYVFLINFNEGVFPKTYMDEDYLNDSEKEKLGLSTSVKLNEDNNSNLIRCIKKVKNLFITYSKYNLSNELYISSLFNSNDMTLIDSMKMEYCFSENYNKLKLVSLKDDFKKFGTLSADLILLNNNYSLDEYCSYDNKFKGLDLNKLNTYLNNKLCLSYTSMNSYYMCSFRYYLDYILKLNKYEDNFSTVIGNIFHKILSECFVDNYEFDKRYEEVVNEINYNLDDMEKYFIDKLKKELDLIINVIKTQLNFISLKKSMYEKEIIIDIDNNSKVTFKGFIDKVLYDDINGKNIAIIIDYKTGNPSLNIDNAIYGLDLQLPVYVYLLKNSNIIENVRVGGFYLQKILSNVKNEKEKISSLKLQGYSNSNLEVLKYVDSSYLNSNIIKSLKMTSNGFYVYSKLMNDDNIDKLSNLVGEKISESSTAILEGKFDINPKSINQTLIGCNYCKYKDICYMTKNDEVVLEPQKSEDFLGGD